jgi:serine/threonine protein phosphatase PrpC
MILYASMSKPGDRANNEDSIGSFANGGRFLFALADGLGGHSGGEIASNLAVSKAMDTFASAPAGEELALCFVSAQNAVMDEQRRLGQPGELKTTLVLLQIGEDAVRWGHVGDSRLYVFQKDKLAAHTRDHSVPQMLVSTGEIREKDVRFHPDRNRLLRVMGIEWDSPRFELSEPCPPEPGISYLLCTDGFWEFIDEKDMGRDLKAARSPEDWLNAMEQRVLKNGRGKNMDNYSAVAVWIR